jgi:phytanoyl-CoA hydroxylase
MTDLIINADGSVTFKSYEINANDTFKNKVAILHDNNIEVLKNNGGILSSSNTVQNDGEKLYVQHNMTIDKTITSLDINDLNKDRYMYTDYERDGYVKLESLFSKEMIDKVNNVIDRLHRTLQPCDTVFDEDGTGKLKQIQYLYRYDPIFKDMIVTLSHVAKTLTGYDDIKVLNMQLFEKHPSISKPTRSHQDNAYFKVTPAVALTCWISLDDIDEGNGALFYAKGTHHLPTRKHVRYNKSTTFRMRSGVPGLSLCLKEHPEELDTMMITRPGDVCIHNCNTIHRAGNNTTNKRRRAIGLVFIPTVCVNDERLTKYHNDNLRDDIELQKYKNPSRYRMLKEQFKYLFE